jgi:hypothetical protein
MMKPILRTVLVGVMLLWSHLAMAQVGGGRLDDLIKRIEDDNEARETAIVRGGSCLFGVL